MIPIWLEPNEVRVHCETPVSKHCLNIHSKCITHPTEWVRQRQRYHACVCVRARARSASLGADTPCVSPPIRGRKIIFEFSLCTETIFNIVEEFTLIWAVILLFLFPWIVSEWANLTALNWRWIGMTRWCLNWRIHLSLYIRTSSLLSVFTRETCVPLKSTEQAGSCGCVRELVICIREITSSLLEGWRYCAGIRWWWRNSSGMSQRTTSGRNVRLWESF